MTAIIGGSKYYYRRCHGHDCAIVKFTSTFDSCHGYDCVIVRFTSTYDSCHGQDCIIEID
jgi:hypothetical protein